MRSITLKNLAPIKELVIGVPDQNEGGVVVLSGANGSGKSHCLNAVAALIGGDPKGIPVRDGAQMASVQGLGVALTIGRRAARAGECEVLALDGPDPSMLVDPGIKDPVAADAARLIALCRLAHAVPDPAPFIALAGGPDAAALVLQSKSLEHKDVPSMAAACKRDFEKAARAAESAADVLMIEARGIAASVADVAETEAPDEAALRQAMRDTSADSGQFAARVAAYSQAREQTQNAMASLDAMVNRGTESNGRVVASNLAAAAQALRASKAVAESLAAQRIALQEAEREALAVVHGETAILAEVERSVARHEADAVVRSRLSKLALSAAAVVEPSAEEGHEIEARIEAATTALSRAEIVRRALAQRVVAAGKADDAGAHKSRGYAMREAGAACEGIVMAAVSAICPEGMSVVGGALHMQTDRGVEPLSELSQGELWSIALPIAAKSVGPNGLIVCRQEGWEALDATNRAEVRAKAIALKVIVLTAQAGIGEIAASVYEGAQ